MKIKKITICSFGLALLILCSKISIPIGPIPYTLQTMVVILLGCLFTKKNLITIFGVYIISGLLGIPVFASGGGLLYLIQPSFGFLLSFLPASLLINILKNKIGYFLSMIISLLLIYTIGIIYMLCIFEMILNISKPITDVIKLAVIPFIVHDIVLGILSITFASHFHNISVFVKLLQD